LLSTLTLLTLLGLNTGGAVVHWARLAQQAFGLGIFPLCLALLVVGIQLLLRPTTPWSRRSWVRLIAAEVAFLALLGLFHSVALGSDPYQLVLEGSGGGAVGWVLAELAQRSDRRCALAAHGQFAPAATRESRSFTCACANRRPTSSNSPSESAGSRRLSARSPISCCIRGEYRQEQAEVQAICAPIWRSAAADAVASGETADRRAERRRG